MALSNKQKNKLPHKYGTWALITGASSGIGKELALLLAQSGLNLVLSARNTELLEALKTQIDDSYKVNVEIFVADLELSSEVEKLIAFCETKDLGLLVANAGFGNSGKFINSSIEAELALLNVNCRALLQLTHHFGIVFSKQKRGGIILLSSVLAFQGAPYAANYAASKAYVQSLGEGLYHELKPNGVDVLCVAPGPVDTGFAKRALMQMNVTMNAADVAESILKGLGNTLTLFPGFLSKLLAYNLKLTPRFLTIRIMKTVMKSMLKP